MKYLIPFWWIEQRVDESGISSDIREVLIGIMSGGLMLFIIFLLAWFAVWKPISAPFFRLLIILFASWAVPNYYISYKYWRKFNENA